MYRFPDTTSKKQLDLTEKSQWFNICQQAGLGNMHSGTIATILKQVEQNLTFKEAATKDEPV